MINSLQITHIPPEDEALREPVRALIDRTMAGVPLENRVRSWMGFDREFSRALAEHGWIGMTLPVEYGGGGRTPLARLVVVEELLAAGAPVAAHWVADRQSGPLICKYGSEEQKQFYLPRICRADAFFCIGMSEPNAGSDLASVRTRAVRTDTGWRLNGRKIWTTNAYRSHYMIALVRTSGSPEDRHRGLSQLIVDLSLPGVTIRPIEDLAGDEHFCEVAFDDVDLSASSLIGDEGSGWEQVTAELVYERSGPERIYSSVVLLDAWLEFLRSTGRLDKVATTTLGRLVGSLAVLRAMSISVAGQICSGGSPAVEAALVKDLGTELEQLIPTLIADALGAEPDSALPGSLLRSLAYVTQVAPSFSLRGGTREILRSMIARGLGLR